MKIKAKTSTSKFDEMLGSKNFLGYLSFLVISILGTQVPEFNNLTADQIGGLQFTGNWQAGLATFAPLLLVSIAKISRSGINWQGFKSMNFRTTLMIGGLILMQHCGYDIQIGEGLVFLNSIFDGSWSEAVQVGLSVGTIAAHSFKPKKYPSAENVNETQRKHIQIEV